MKYLISIIAAVLIAAPAAAQPYVGASFGQSDIKDFCDGVTGAGVSCDDSDTAWRILGGYQFTPNVALELGYTNLGEAKASGPGGTVKAEATAIELVALGILPLADRFALYAKAGLYRGETEFRANTVLITGNETESNTDLTFGFGARFDITPRVALRAEWQRYTDMGGGDFGESDVDVISVGALFRF